MSIIFGPIASRRLGNSLGIDLVKSKTCNLDCLYCEVGKTNALTETRQTFIDLDALVTEIKACPHKIDCLTLTGAGEPTLHKDIDKIIARLGADFNYPLVLITNSLLLREEAVRQEILGLDIVMPSLDAVSQDVFETINKPVAGVLASDIIEGLVRFRELFMGKIWLEILFVKGINDAPSEVLALKHAIERICPDRIQLNTVVRMPAYKEGVEPVSIETLQSIAEVLGFDNIDILSLKRGASTGQTLDSDESEAIRFRRPDIEAVDIIQAPR